ncbi:MAG: flagellar protein FliS [Planctomycetota bacterium]
MKKGQVLAPVNATLEYTKNAVMTASKAKLIVMMYEGAIRFAEQARFHGNRGSHAACGTAISNCYNIVSELKIALDPEPGGVIGKKITEDLAALYAFVLEQLVGANVDRNMDNIDNVLDVLKVLKEGWDGAAQQI